MGLLSAGLAFFFMRLRSFLFFIGPTAFPIASIHLSNTNRGLNSCLKPGFDGFIEDLVLEVQFLMPTIYLSLNGGSKTLLEILDQYFFIKSCNKVKLLKHGL